MDTGQTDEASALPAQLARYYKEMLAIHDDVRIGICIVCRVSRCQDWRAAYERLVSAGEPVAGPRVQNPEPVDASADGQR
jgi:hypothetical protein